jgi:hypothetical protein
MIEIRPATEDEVVLAFLQAEVNSSRYGPNIVGWLGFLGMNRLLIDSPVLTDAVQNEARRRVLGGHRGYPNRTLFEGFPSDVEWRRVQIEPADFGTLRYAKHDVLLRLSGGSRLIEAFVGFSASMSRWAYY